MHEAEALTLATSLFPDKPHETHSSSKVREDLRTLAHVETDARGTGQMDESRGRTRSSLKRHRTDGIHLSRRGPQRGGVLGALNMVADSLKLLPKASDTKQRWTTKNGHASGVAGSS